MHVSVLSCHEGCMWDVSIHLCWPPRPILSIDLISVPARGTGPYFIHLVFPLVYYERLGKARRSTEDCHNLFRLWYRWQSWLCSTWSPSCWGKQTILHSFSCLSKLNYRNRPRKIYLVCQLCISPQKNELCRKKAQSWFMLRWIHEISRFI